MDDDILDIDEVLTDSFYMPSEECYNDIQNIVQQWKKNESAPINVQNECTKYFDTRTFTRQKKRLNSTTNGLSDLDYPKSIGFPVDNQTSCRNFIIDSSPSNSLCSYVSDDATSLITSGDFSNVSYFINNANDITLQFNELDLKRMDETRCSSSTDASQNSTAKRIVTHNATIVGKNSDVPGNTTISSDNDELSYTHTVPTVNRTFEKEFKINSTFEKKLEDTFEEISGKITHSVVPRRNVDKYDCLNLVQSTPKVSRMQPSRRSATPPNLSPISPKKHLFGTIADDYESNTFIADMPLDMEESISNDEQPNSLVNFEEFEKSIFLDDDKGDEDLETLLGRMGNSKRLDNRDVMKESLDNIKKRHSLLNLEIKQEHQREKMNNHHSGGDNKSLVTSLHKSIPDERLLKRSRLFDNITLNMSASADNNKSERSISTTMHLDSNRTYNNQSAQRNDSNHLRDNDNDVYNTTVTVEKSPKPLTDISTEKMSPEIEEEQPEKYDNRDRFKTIRLFKKSASTVVVTTDTPTQFVEPAPIKTSIVPKHIEPVSKLKSRQISTLSSRDSYLKSSSVENLNTRGFQKLKADINTTKSSSTQSLDKTSGLPKTSMLRNRTTTTTTLPKNVKPNNVQNVIQKSIPILNSRTNVNKFSGLVRPSSGYYSYNTEVDKFEAVNSAQSSGDSTFISNNVISDEPKQQPSRIAKPSGLRPPSKISCLPRPMSKR